MDFTACLRAQLAAHPAMQPRDVIKLCYQAARGAEHLLSDEHRARAFFLSEYDATPADESLPLFEVISPAIARANLAAWKAANLPAEWLFRMFLHTAKVPQGGDDLLSQHLAEASALLKEAAPFPCAAWEEALAAWRDAGMPAVHHSETYREQEKPAYRIVRREFMCILPILTHLTAHPEVRVMAIDGRAASGKSTKAGMLTAIFDAPVIRMDDFFLPPELRTPERLAQPGGNIHYERFAEEALPGLQSGEAFSYRVFDCQTMTYAGVREIPAAPMRIVEGSYALHPHFGDYADLKVFSTVDAQEQMARILRRNGERMAEMFRTRWIPMEEAYFETFNILQQADFID